MFFAMDAETIDEGNGTEYVEVIGDRVVRQIWQLGKLLLWSSPNGCKNERYDFTDQPEWDSGRGAINLRSVTREEFEELWLRAGGTSPKPV